MQPVSLCDWEYINSALLDQIPVHVVQQAVLTVANQPHKEAQQMIF